MILACIFFFLEYNRLTRNSYVIIIFIELFLKFVFCLFLINILVTQQLCLQNYIFTLMSPFISYFCTETVYYSYTSITICYTPTLHFYGIQCGIAGDKITNTTSSLYFIVKR